MVYLPLHQEAGWLTVRTPKYTLARVENNILETNPICVCPVGAGETIKHVPLLRESNVRENSVVPALELRSFRKARKGKSFHL